MIGYLELKPGAWWKKLNALTSEEEKTGYSLRGERQPLFLLMWGQLIWSHGGHWTLKSRVCTEHHGLVRGSPCGTFLVAISQDVDITGWDEMWNCKTFQRSQTLRSKLKIPLRFALGSREKRGRLRSTWTRVDITSHGGAATRSPYVPLNDDISTSASAPPTSNYRERCSHTGRQIRLFYIWVSVLEEITSFLSVNLKLPNILWNVHIFLGLNRGINRLKQNGFVIPGDLAPTTTWL